MHNLVAAACLLLGGFLLLFGFGLHESLSAELWSVLAGAPDDDVKWLVYAGVLFAGLGSVAILKSGAGPR
jgi:hypothetical protein